ncbi:MAG: hypothetical protein WAW13_00490 [Minisyncoccia bacterium]
MATLYTLATIAMFGICALARVATPDAERIARAAAWVALFTGMSRVIGYFTDAPWSLVHYPAQDLLMLTLAFGWWQVRREWWALSLALLFLAQLFLHALFWFDAASSLRGYIVANNAFFILQLLTLTIAGGSHALGWVRDRVRLFRGRADSGVWVLEATK